MIERVILPLIVAKMPDFGRAMPLALMILLYFVVPLIAACVFGCITDYLGKLKGYRNCFLWGFFLLIIGMLVIAIMPDRKAEQRNEEKPSKKMSIEEALQKYERLKEKGVITEEEYQEKRKQILKL